MTSAEAGIGSTTIPAMTHSKMAAVRHPCGVMASGRGIRWAIEDLPLPGPIKLDAAGVPLVFLHLAGDEALIRTRIEARRGHFMPPSLLPAQFATLEPPGPDEPDVVPIDAGPATPEQVAAAVAALKARGAG